MKKLLTVIQSKVLEPQKRKKTKEERIEAILKAVEKFPWNYQDKSLNDTGRAYARELCLYIDNENTNKITEDILKENRKIVFLGGLAIYALIVLVPIEVLLFVVLLLKN